MKKILIGVCLLSTLLSAKPRVSWGGSLCHKTYIYEEVLQAKTRYLNLIGYDRNSNIVLRKKYKEKGVIYHVFFYDNQIVITDFRGKHIDKIDISKIKFLRIVGE